MGLDITAYSKCAFVHSKEVGEETNYDECWDKGHILIYTYDSFVERLDGLQQGCYISNGECMGFRAGSYSGYGRWRAELAFLALGTTDISVNWEDYVGKPFFELIWMADNEGSIGPMTSTKLAHDFETTLLTGDDTFMHLCQQWQMAFELASDHGWVVFH